MEIRAYSEKRPIIFLSVCSLPYAQMAELTQKIQKSEVSLPFFRFFESKKKVRLVMGIDSLSFAVEILQFVSVTGGASRLLTDTTLCTLSSMGCRKSKVVTTVVEMCDERKIEIHHLGITDTEVMLCISSRDRDKFREGIFERTTFIT